MLFVCVNRNLHVVWTCVTSASAVWILLVAQTLMMLSTADSSRPTTSRYVPHLVMSYLFFCYIFTNKKRKAPLAKGQIFR